MVNYSHTIALKVYFMHFNVWLSDRFYYQREASLLNIFLLALTKLESFFFCPRSTKY